MKAKFVNVWDNRKWGYIGFIVLQVEETDTFLVKHNFDPGYKFVIQAWYNHVGAAGGHKFIPSYGEGIQEKSRKIETNEADVFGLYLSNIVDIYDIPDELDTKNFWGIMNTKIDEDKEAEEIDYSCDEYYKVAYKRHIESFNQMTSLFENQDELLNDNFSREQILEIQENNRRLQRRMVQMGADLDQESYRVYYGYVNKNTLELKGVYEEFGTSSNEHIINKYLWLQNDEMPKKIWDDVKYISQENDGISKDDELYFH